MIPLCVTIIDLSLYGLHCQKSLKSVSIRGASNVGINFKSYMKTTRIIARSAVIPYSYKWPGSSLSNPLLFADNNNLFLSGRYNDMIMETLNNELKEISL